MALDWKKVIRTKRPGDTFDCNELQRVADAYHAAGRDGADWHDVCKLADDM